jgi:hypothetical protein
MGLFSNPRRDFLFQKTTKLIGANGLEIASINLVADPKNKDENFVIFLKNGGPENRYHVLGKKNLKTIIDYIEVSSASINSDERPKRDFGELVGSIVTSFIRGFVASFRLETRSQIRLEDADFDDFGKMLVGSDFGSQKKQFYVMYTADEFTTLERMSKSGLIESLSGLKEIYALHKGDLNPRSFDQRRRPI